MAGSVTSRSARRVVLSPSALPVKSKGGENMNSYELMINRLAQGLIPIDDGIDWFKEMGTMRRGYVLEALAMCCGQAHPLPSEVEPAIAAAGLKPTFTPCVMLKKATLPARALSRIVRLPSDENEKAFRVLLALFSIADKRRRETACKDGCYHEWHNLDRLD